MSVKNRVKEFCKYSKIAVSKFEESILVANGYVNSISKSIGIDKIELILEKYPNLSLEWLLAGKGAMLKSENKILTAVNEPPGEYKTEPSEKESLLKENDFMKEQIEFYKIKIEFLETQLKAKKTPRVKTHEEVLKMLQDAEDELLKKMKN